ncbi:MAG: hypothetical protein Q9Q40_14230, partial [Acidobacteriota bacterium]|nr:hypothetical protein [Acidobacteriota bacterium]
VGDTGIWTQNAETLIGGAGSGNEVKDFGVNGIWIDGDYTQSVTVRDTFVWQEDPSLRHTGKGIVIRKETRTNARVTATLEGNRVQAVEVGGRRLTRTLRTTRTPPAISLRARDTRS